MLYITDPLTSLYNRRGFFRIYNDYAEGGVKDDCMVISVDLDNLKLINDNFGHNEGDNATHYWQTHLSPPQTRTIYAHASAAMNMSYSARERANTR